MNQVWIVFDRSGEVVGVLDSEEKPVDKAGVHIFKEDFSRFGG